MELVNSKMPTYDNNASGGGLARGLLKQKWLLVVVSGVGIFTLILLLLFSGQSVPAPYSDTAASPSGVLVTQAISTLTPSPTPTLTVELKAAVDEAQQASQGHNTAQDTIRAQYPWIRKFPLSQNGKYFLYFDTERELFVGKLYPAEGDTIEQIKADARAYMIERQVPPDAYPYEWLVFPQ